MAFCNAPDVKTARAIARHLVQSRLAACVSILPASTSVYRWQGKICEDSEVPMIVKTAAAHLPDIQNTLRQMHPDDTPELIALPVVGGLPDYLQWAEESVK